MVSVGVPLSLALSAEAADFWEEFGDNDESPEPWLTELLIKNFGASEQDVTPDCPSAVRAFLACLVSRFVKPLASVSRESPQVF